MKNNTNSNSNHQQVNNYFPPSPIDTPSTPTLQKDYGFPINTNNGKQFIDYTSTYSPPTSPLILTNYHDQSNPQQKQQHQRRKSHPPPQNIWEPQWEVDIQSLTLENAKLQRTNRILKVDREAWLQEQIRPLDEQIRELTAANIRWQRASRLLQQELDESNHELNAFKENQLQQSMINRHHPIHMNDNITHHHTGSEYQYLVNMIHFLQDHQTSKKEDNSDEAYSSDQSIEKKEEIEEEKRKKNQTNSSSILSNYNKKIYQLEKKMETLSKNLNTRENDIVLLTNELSKKDQMVTQLNNQLIHFRQMIEKHGIPILSKPLDHTLNDSLSDDDNNIELEQQQKIKKLHRLTCLSIDSTLSNGSTLYDEYNCTTPDLSSSSPKHHHHQYENNNMIIKKKLPGTFIMVEKMKEGHSMDDNDDDDSNIIPTWMTIFEQEYFISFILLSVILGLASKLGISDDWMVPSTLFTLVLCYLKNAASDFQVRFSS
ncbi:unnamed protein product [Cunninghamella blakesleeana]